jgi:peroxiredoxin
LRDRYDELRERHVEVLALAPASPDEARRFAGAHGIPFPLLADPALNVFRAYHVDSHLLSLGQRPALYAVDRKGVVRYAHLGRQQWQVGSIDQAIATLERS